MLLSNRVAIITGGSKGIGKGIALKYAEEGCSIVIADIIEEAATQTVADISGLNQESFFVPCDVSKSKFSCDLNKRQLCKFFLYTK